MRFNGIINAINLLKGILIKRIANKKFTSKKGVMNVMFNLIEEINMKIKIQQNAIGISFSPGIKRYIEIFINSGVKLKN